jgi:predicted HTH transcriptional regulator
MEQLTIQNIKDLAENVELEAKRATGRHGRGELPDDFFKSYSAMANTNGGIIFLGIEEKPKGAFRTVGIQDAAKVLKSLWDGLNNPQRVNLNILNDSHVKTVMVEGKHIIRITVPRASRHQIPIYIGLNPVLGCYTRRYEGDYRCDLETVKRMMAEQVEEARDAKPLAKFSLLDIDRETFTAYRNLVAASKPEHPYNELDDTEFLRSIGGWFKDRESGEEGLTLAGLLMFGKLVSIKEAVPNYMLDYQERPEPKTEPRWIDRVTTDGTWPGNIFDFYRRIIRKLTTDLKVPFKLTRDLREDDTPVHEALREALVNTLIHADYSGRVSVLVVKRPDMFGFRNPGNMRIPIETAIQGGDSDCRNRGLQLMFRHAGLAEQAGSGIPKIYRNWRRQHWRAPLLHENDQMDQTLLELRMASLLPDEIVSELDQKFGERFRSLADDQRLALATAAIEGSVTHGRLRQITTVHPHDLSKSLGSLVRDEFLESHGMGRGTYYVIPGERPTTPFTAIDETEPVILDSAEKSFSLSSQHLAASSQHLIPSSQHLERLKDVAVLVRNKRKVSREQMISVILALCEGCYISSRELAELVQRAPDSLRNHYLNELVGEGKLELMYPDKPSDPRQRYRTKAQTRPI